MPSPKLILLIVVFMLAINYPFLHIVTKGGHLMGIPSVVVFIFAWWMAFVFMLYRISSKNKRRQDEQP